MSEVRRRPSLLLILCYLPLFGVIPLFLRGSSREVRWHARNGLLLFAGVVVMGVLATLVGLLLPSLSCLYGIGMFFVGVVYVDGYAWPTLGFYYRHYRRRFFALHSWRRFTSRALARLAGRKEVGEVYTRDYPSQQSWRAAVRTLVHRGVRLYFVFTGSARYVFNHDEQLATLLNDRALARRVDLLRYRSADHIFSGVADRQRFVSDLLDWISTRFTPKAEPAPQILQRPGSSSLAKLTKPS